MMHKVNPAARPAPQGSRAKTAARQAARMLINSAPILTGVIILVSVIGALVPKEALGTLFSGNRLLDPIVGSALGSVLGGNPITSYVLGGELLKQGVSLMAVTAFLVAWVTVGLIQLPAESLLLGKRFAIARNLTAFVCSIIVALITVSALHFLGVGV